MDFEKSAQIYDIKTLLGKIPIDVPVEKMLDVTVYKQIAKDKKGVGLTGTP